MREENTFEDPLMAQEWIEAIESEEGGSRDREIYPLLSTWVGEIQPKVLVEIGSGQGICSSKIDLDGVNYIGIEPSGVLVSRAKVHIEDLDKAHAEISRVLKKGAEVIIITSNPNLHNMWESWFIDPEKEGKKLIGKVNVPTKTLSKNIFYLHSEKEITESLEKNSIKIVSIKKFGFGREGEGVHRDEGVWMAIRGKKE
ncbi:MAG: hypothetical protein AB198_00045 [Parcubacteria bacterium C7867-003]|nr:MAG: hypothetical protein AB198_00045 [Parcubacteria bacterium C7867-003]